MADRIILGDAGWLRPTKWRWVRALLWLVALAVLTILAFNLAADAMFRLTALLTGEPFTTRAEAPTWTRFAAVVAGSAGMLGSYALAVRYVEQRSVPELGLRHIAPDLVGGLTIGTILIAIIIAVQWAGGWVTITVAQTTILAEPLKQAIQSGVIEEVLMRIIIFRLLWRVSGVIPALLMTALLFGGLHLSNPDATIFSAVCLIAGEGVGAGLFLLTGRVWMSIGMHAGWNFALGWIFGSAVSGLNDFAGGPLVTRPVEGVPTFLSGGGFGAESSLAALFVSLLASMLCLGLAWRRKRFVAELAE
jgi:membrane protease YdiL (CAAX protease family)